MMRIRQPLLFVLDGKTAVPTDDEKRWAHGRRLLFKTKVPGSARVSTVFTGVDLNWLNEGAPLVFETMIFGGRLDQSRWRHASWEQAEAAHKTAVELATEAWQADQEATS